MIWGRIKRPSHVMSTDCHVLVKSRLLSKRTKGVLICSSLVLKSSAVLVDTHKGVLNGPIVDMFEKYTF